MKYFFVMGDVHAYESDGSQDAFIPAGAIPMTAAEVEAHLAPSPRTLSDCAPVSMAQMRAALVLFEIITRPEAAAWAAGTLPEVIIDAINGLGFAQAVIAEQRALSATKCDPTDLLVSMLSDAMGKSEAEMIALFKFAASL